MHLSLLQRHRLTYQPVVPPLLRDLSSVHLNQIFLEDACSKIDPALSAIFPCALNQPLVTFQLGEKATAKSLKVGVLFSGGQAPGGHNILTGIHDALKKMHPSSELMGFLDGPSGLINNKFIILTENFLAPYRNQGGFTAIGSGRTKIETDAQFEAVEKTLREHELEGLVIIGGDDSNTNAAFLAEFCKQRQLPACVIGVPKTIDGDLKNSFIETSFGFDTASKVYSEIIGNLALDALSAKKYYFFVKMMGRAASHLTLECALQTQVNLTLISEEIQAAGYTLDTVVNQVADLIVERAERQKNFGIILIPEGLLEFIPDCQKLIQELNVILSNQKNEKLIENQDFSEKLRSIYPLLSPAIVKVLMKLPFAIQQQLLIDRDEHGNVRLSKIETEKLLIELVEENLKQRKKQGQYKGNFNAQSFFCGYEGRAGLPSNFDCDYCYTLGQGAALLIQAKMSGYMCCVKNLVQPVEKWEVQGVPLTHLLHFEMRKGKKQAVIQKVLVDLQGKVFLAFKQLRENWRLEDQYSCPGPLQFKGSAELIDQRSLTLRYEQIKDFISHSYENY